MSLSSIGDLSQTFLARRQNFALKTDLGRLTQELSTGQKADISTALRGRLIPLAEAETRLTALAAHIRTGGSAARELDLAQLALSNLQTTLSDTAQSTSLVALTDTNQEIDRAAASAREGLASALGALNLRSNGIALFGGTQGVDPALAEAGTILADLTAFVAATAPATAADALVAVDAWFAPASGFDTVAYLGNTTNPSARRIGEGETVALGTRADGPQIREAIKALATAALAADGLLPIPREERAALALAGSEALRSADGRVVALQGDIGALQGRVETVLARNEAERAGLEQMRNAMIEADPFETASALEQVQLQLETHYTLTARLSRLNLVSFLR